MFFIVKTLHSVLKVLNSETARSQLAAGVMFGMVMGLGPTLTLHNLLLFFVVALFRVNLSIFFVSLGFFSFVGWLFDPVWDKLGYWLLVDLKAVRPLWIEFSTGPILPYFRFNNTIVIGSLVFGLIAALPIFLISMKFVSLYRARWREKIQSSKFVKILKATPFYGMYEKYQAAKSKLGLIS